MRIGGGTDAGRMRASAGRPASTIRSIASDPRLDDSSVEHFETTVESYDSLNIGDLTERFGLRLRVPKALP
jgi:hypothetical protein